MSGTWVRDRQQVLVEAGRGVIADVHRHARRPVDAFCIVVEWCEGPDGEVRGLNESLVARTLHDLWPDRYPSVVVSHETNEVDNAAAFRFTPSDQV